jgi:glycosyltransferase involved in cell wall biosynthesis
VASDRSIARPVSPAVLFYEKLFAPYTTRLANSRAVAASLAQRYGLSTARIRVIYNAVDRPSPAPEDVRSSVRAEIGLPERQMIILMVGRQSPEKNHAMFLRAAQRVGQRRGDVTFVILGHLFRPDDLHTLVDATGAAPHVRIIDQREDVPRWLAAADLFCMTSNVEGLPNAVLEAMAAGLPVVCTDFESARELIADGRTGLLVPRDDDEALAAAILTLLADSGRRRDLGAAAREHARTQFGWGRLVGEMESLYAGLLREQC